MPTLQFQFGFRDTVNQLDNDFDNRVMTVFDMQVMQDLKFLPLTQEAVEQKVTAFRTYTDEIRRSLPDVLLAMMTLLLNQYRAKYVLTLHTDHYYY